MSLSVELLYFDGCPHVPAAREQVRRAFELVDLAPHWVEVDVTDCPDPERQFGSPSVLVNGREITGASPGGALACRVYLDSDMPGAPPLATIVSALRAAMLAHDPASP